LKAKIIGISIAVAVVAAVLVAILYVGPIDVSEPQKKDEFANWNRSGPFAINKFEYKIGESVFIAIEDLKSTDIGSMVFVMPNGTTKYIAIPFDGTAKSGFNQYFKPAISKGRGICSVDDLIGKWTVVFTGTDYTNLTFNIKNETIPDIGTDFNRVC
jgi:hypothetical protein